MKKRKSVSRLVSILTAIVICLMVLPFALLAYFPPKTVNAASQADALISVALAEEGYTEGANNYSKYGEWYYNNVSQNADYSHSQWCAMFISWCARQAGIPTSVIKNNAWAGSMSSSKGTGNFGAPYYPKGSITPQKGDIVYYGWGSSKSQHVEIVISTSGSTFTSIGGNTGGGTKVYIHRNYSFTSSDVVGYERPNYNGSVNPPTQNNDDELGIPYPRPSGSPLLSTGSRGSGVSWLQTALNKANNAGLAVDGQFGSGTKQAVINFQKANGLEADGIAGPATINKLVEVIKGQMNPPEPIVPQGRAMSESEAAGQTIPNGDYLIYSSLAENYALDIPGDGISESGANIQMWKWANGVKPTVYDVFTVTYCGNGFYEIRQKNTDLCLDVYNGSLDMGTNVQLWSKNDSPAQQWSITRTEVGCMLQARCNGYCLDVFGGNVENETNVQVYENNGTTSQRFIFASQRLNLEAPNLNVDVNGQEVTFSWNLVANATHYDVRVYNSDGSSYENFWGGSDTQTSLSLTMPANKEFSVQVCAANKNYENCFTYCQPISFKTGIHKHEWGEWKIEKPATCTSNGYKKRNCLGCEKTEEAIIYATGHDWSEWKVVKESTCTTQGERSRTCDICKAYEGYSIPVISHKYAEKIVKPTYAENGYTLHTCYLCGNSYKDNFTEKLAKLKGDINDDGKADIADLVILQKWLLGSGELTNWKNADLCEDGVIDAFDVAALRRLLLN